MPSTGRWPLTATRPPSSWPRPRSHPSTGPDASPPATLAARRGSPPRSLGGVTCRVVVWERLAADHASVRPLGGAGRPLRVLEPAADRCTFLTLPPSSTSAPSTPGCASAPSHRAGTGATTLPFQDLSRLEPLWLPCELPESSVAATEVLAGRVLAPAGALDLAGLARLLCFSAGVTRFLQDVLFRAAPRPARCTRRRWTWSAAPLAACPPGWTTSSRPSWSCVGCKRGTSGPAWPPPPRSR